MPTPRKKIRLARNEYIGRRIYFLTICTEAAVPSSKMQTVPRPPLNLCGALQLQRMSWFTLIA